MTDLSASASELSPGTWTLAPYVAGRLPIPGWECYFGRNDFDFYDLVFYVIVVRRGDQIGLIDTGLPIDAADLEQLNLACQGVDEQCYFRDVTLLPDILVKASIEPDAIDFVLISQPITYCTGGLSAGVIGTPQLYMAKDGLEEFLYEAPGHPPRDAYFTRDSWAFLYDSVLANRMHGVRGRASVAEGLSFESTGGHHPGSAAVLIEGATPPIALIETAFRQDNIDDDVPIGIAESVSKAREAVRSFKQRGYQAIALRDPRLAELVSSGEASTPE